MYVTEPKRLHMVQAGFCTTTRTFTARGGRFSARHGWLTALSERKVRQKRRFVASSRRAGLMAGRVRPAVPLVQENQAPDSASENVCLARGYSMASISR